MEAGQVQGLSVLAGSWLRSVTHRNVGQSSSDNRRASKKSYVNVADSSTGRGEEKRLVSRKFSVREIAQMVVKKVGAARFLRVRKR